MNFPKPTPTIINLISVLKKYVGNDPQRDVVIAISTNGEKKKDTVGFKAPE